jgi:hypothetical protein
MSTSRQPCCAAEPKPTAPVKLRCPACGQDGQPVETRTLKHHVRPEHLQAVERGPFNFCRARGCDVVYFNGNGLVLRKPDVRTRIGLKETDDPVPICYGFGFTEKMVLDEARASGNGTIPQRIAAEIKAGHCACEIRNPQGSCCLGHVNAAVRRALRGWTAGRIS